MAREVTHKLEVVEIYHEGEAFMSITLECPDCPDVNFGISHWGEEVDGGKLVAEAQRQHEISIRYDKFGER